MNYASWVEVQYRQDREMHFKTVPKYLQIAGREEKSREKRHETLFEVPVRAR